MPWIDQNHIVLSTSGDANPIALVYRGPLQGKILLGDPCIIPWSTDADNITPTVALRGSNAFGVRIKRTAPLKQSDVVQTDENGKLDVISPTKLGRLLSEPCTALPRLALPNNVSIVTGEGTVGFIDRPPELLAAQEAAYKQFFELN